MQDNMLDEGTSLFESTASAPDSAQARFRQEEGAWSRIQSQSRGFEKGLSRYVFSPRRRVINLLSIDNDK